MSKLSGEYRTKAADLRGQARLEPNPQMKAGLEKLALGYVHLAELAERSRGDSIAGAPPPSPTNDSTLSQ
jgi:hypothetical protein